MTSSEGKHHRLMIMDKISRLIDKLYNINANLSIMAFIHKKPMTIVMLDSMNRNLEDIIDGLELECQTALKPHIISLETILLVNSSVVELRGTGLSVQDMEKLNGSLADIIKGLRGL